MLFDPRCNVPTFQQTDGDIVKMCGRDSGYIFAGILSLFVLSFPIYAVYATFWKPDDNDPKNRNKDDKARKKQSLMSLAVIFVLTIAVLALIWLGVPPLVEYFNHNSWLGYQEQIKQLESQGYSHQKALNKIQKWEQTMERARAERQGAADIAAAIRDSNRNRQMY